MKKTNYNLSKIKPAFDKAAPEFHAPRGNSKTGEIAAFNLLPVMTCSSEACKTCAVDGCYAVKNMFRCGYNYDTNNVLKAWADNTKLAKTDLEKLEAHLDAYFSIMELSITSCKYFRIHAAGDFFSVDYAAVWYRVAKNHPTIKFLAFTKQWDVVRSVPFYELDNFSLVLSGWTGCTIPVDLMKYYKCAFCVEHGDTCSDPTALECPGNCDRCGMCWNLKKLNVNTYFNKH